MKLLNVSEKGLKNFNFLKKIPILIFLFVLVSLIVYAHGEETFAEA